MSVTTSKFNNCCPSCTSMMAIRVGQLTKARAEALDVPSAQIDPFVGQQLLMCWLCGNVAPKSAWDRIDSYNQWRMCFSGSIIADSREQTQKNMAQSLRRRATELVRQADKLAGITT